MASRRRRRRARPPVETPPPPAPTAASTTTAAATSPPLDLPPSVPQARSLVLDSKAIDNLELFANSSDHGADGTLFKVLDKTASPFGKRLLRRWVCAPLRAVDEISERQVTRRCYCHRHTLRHHHRHLHLTTPPPYVRTRWAR